MEKVLISGGSGLIGRALSSCLKSAGYDVAILSRRPGLLGDIPVFRWDYVNRFIDPEALKYSDVIIHLAGVNIGEKRWSSKRKRLILESRVKSAEFLHDSFLDKGIKPKVYITASAVGYYGTLTSDRIFSEEDSHANDFLGNVCHEWEEVAMLYGSSGARTVKIRTGIVLAGDGEAYKRISMSLKFRVAAILSKGKQFFPWIHLSDLINVYFKAVEDKGMTGAYNAVSPEHLNYRQFMKKLVQTKNKRVIFVKVPKILLKIVFGKMSEILFKGSRISSQKLLEAGIQFEYSSIQAALYNIEREIEA